MRHILTHLSALIILAFGPASSVAVSRLQFDFQPDRLLADSTSANGSKATLLHDAWSRYAFEKRSNLNKDPNGSTFLWLPQDEYSGTTFFDRWTFFNNSDPTNGAVTYVDQSTAFADGLAYVQSDGTVIMKGDDTTWLENGTYRNSVRISSTTQYNTGLFILDVNRAPWGCGVWPAFWTLGDGTWPYTGEIDIIEGVHDNEHNQVTWHTAPGCTLNPQANFSGTIVQLNDVDNLDCNGLINSNSGCGITEWSKASYGPYFDSQGGGVFAMKWDENGIAAWSFYRAAIPQDILQGSPDPSNWGVPSASLEPGNCNPLEYFSNHSIVFDITFCGDWAGNSYATSGCPGTCQDRLMDPSNFVNASWSINSLKVYRKQLINGQVQNSSTHLTLDSILLLIHFSSIVSILVITLF